MAMKDQDTMQLPFDKTCQHCRYFRWCQKNIWRQGDEQICDWSPSRFTEKEKKKDYAS